MSHLPLKILYFTQNCLYSKILSLDAFLSKREAESWACNEATYKGGKLKDNNNSH